MTRPDRLRTVPLVLAAGFSAAAALALVGASQAASAATATPGHCYKFIGEGTEFHGYDYNATVANCNDVDWATSLIFYNNATINSVKSKMDRPFKDGSTERKHMLVKSDNSGLEWDEDAGKKTILCPTFGSTAAHFRIYAPPSRDYLHSVSYGFWVVGTTHRDANECPPIGKKHYGSEEVERYVGGVARGKGFFVTNDYRNLLNAEPYRVEGNHTWDNNGWATFIQIP